VKKLNPKEVQLTKSLEVAAKMGDHVVSIFKASSLPVRKDNMQQTLLFNEVSKSSLDLLRKTIEEV